MLIRKGREPVRNARAMTVIMFTASLEHAVCPLDKALAGAVLGMDVNVVLEGAAVRLLKRGYRPRLSGLAGGVFTAVAERMVKRQIGWPVPQESILILEDLGARTHGRPAQMAWKLTPAISCRLPVVAAPRSARGLGPPSARQRRCRRNDQI